MCPCENGVAPPPADNSEMVQVPLNGSAAHSVPTNGVNGHANGHTNGATNGSAPQARPVNPYAPRASDFLSNVSNFSIIESTLRGKSARSRAVGKMGVR